MRTRSRIFNPDRISIRFPAVAVLSLAVILAGFVACQKEPVKEPAAVYRAELHPLNESVTGYSPSGTVTLTHDGDSLTISVTASNLPPGMHLMHYHGFVDGHKATCVTMAQDTNKDSILDDTETMSVSGITLVPFTDDPVSLKINSDTYPVADSSGNLTYEKTVSYDALVNALSAEHGITEPVFENRVVYIHGANVDLPETVMSLPDVPATVTLPIACGEFVAVKQQTSE